MSIVVVYADKKTKELVAREFDTDEGKEVFLELSDVEAIVVHADSDLHIEKR